MKATYLSLTLSVLAVALLASCGPDAINNGKEPKGEVTSLTLSASTATLKTGETLQLTATVTPADAKVTYTTDNASIASISETGLIKALTPGSATITAQAGEKKATCTITVTEAYVQTENVDLLCLLDQKRYPTGSTIDYVDAVPADEADFYNLQLAFSVLKTTDYAITLTCEKPVNASVCIGPECKLVEKMTTHTEQVSLTSDQEANAKGKEKGQPSSLDTHLTIPAKAGETYTNRLGIKLVPIKGGKTLEWTVNLAITVK